MPGRRDGPTQPLLKGRIGHEAGARSAGQHARHIRLMHSQPRARPGRGGRQRVRCSARDLRLHASPCLATQDVWAGLE